MLRMLDRHAIQELLRADVPVRQIARQFAISRWTVRRIARETAVASSEETRSRAHRGIGRPGVSEAVRARVAALVGEDATLPPGEIARRLREEGTPLGLSTLYRVLGGVRATVRGELLVRLEGLAGEFAQFDFGEVSVALVEGPRRVVHFAAYRLKYSRWIHVVLVPNERVEALIRSLLAGFEASSGVPLRVVFDNPKTVVLRYEDGRPVWNATLAQVAIDYGFTIELCTPHQPQQKGAVENLVGFVKRSFFRARRFQDLERDLPEQLAAWLVEVNTVRPCRATREIPAARLPAEQARLKPLAVAPAAYRPRSPAPGGQRGRATHRGIRYAMPPPACGLPATLWLYPDRVKIVTAGSRHEALHPRFPPEGPVSYLAGPRAPPLAPAGGAGE